MFPDGLLAPETAGCAVRQATLRPPPSVFVGYETRDDFEAVHGPMLKQIAVMLTGLTWRQLEKLGVEFFDAAAGKRIKTLAA